MRRVILSIILLSIYTFATPTIYNNTGLVTKLEKFASTCSYYSRIAKKDLRIKSLCRKYKKNLNVALKLGYRIDKSTSDNSSLSEKYLAKLLSLDALYEQTIEKISIVKRKARESNDAIYHEKIIRKDVISLYKSDYEFVAKHRDVYIKADNPRYLKMLKDGREEFLSQEEHTLLIQKRKEEQINHRRDECENDMTIDRHSAHDIGKISNAIITGSNGDGYYVKTPETIFFIQGEPRHSASEDYITSYVISEGEKMSATNINMRSALTPKMWKFYIANERRLGIREYGEYGNVLIVHHNSECAALSR